MKNYGVSFVVSLNKLLNKQYISVILDAMMLMRYHWKKKSEMLYTPWNFY